MPSIIFCGSAPFLRGFTPPSTCEARNKNIAIFLPGMYTQDGTKLPATLEALRSKVSDLPNNPKCLSLVAPEIQFGKLDQAIWAYRLHTDNNSLVLKNSPSPALAIARHFNKNIVISEKENMALAWPMIGSKENLEQSKNCVTELNFSKKIFLNMAFQSIGEMTSSPLPLCAYHWELSLMKLLSSPSKDFQNQKNPREQLIFIISTSFFGGGKNIVSPVGQTLAAAHVHAVALDNLLKYKETYRRSGDFAIWDLNAPSFWFSIMVLLSICISNIVWQSIHMVGVVKKLRSVGFLKRTTWFRRVTSYLRGQARWVQASWRFIFSVVLTFLGFLVIFWIGDSCFYIGILEIAPFMILPILSTFLNTGRTLAKYSAILWAGTHINLDKINQWLNYEARQKHR